MRLPGFALMDWVRDDPSAEIVGAVRRVQAHARATRVGASAPATVRVDTADSYAAFRRSCDERMASLAARLDALEAELHAHMHDPAAHADLLAVAHDDARLVLNRDPDLKSPRGDALRVLLYLFGRDEAVRRSRALARPPARACSGSSHYSATRSVRAVRDQAGLQVRPSRCGPWHTMRSL